MSRSLRLVEYCPLEPAFRLSQAKMDAKATINTEFNELWVLNKYRQLDHQSTIEEDLHPCDPVLRMVDAAIDSLGWLRESNVDEGVRHPLLVQNCTRHIHPAWRMYTE